MDYGLIGGKLGHSYSKDIHEMLADYTYDLCPLTKEEFVPFMEQHAFRAIMSPFLTNRMLFLTWTA